MKMKYAIPALPVTNVAQSIAFYVDTLGFTLVYQAGGFAIVRRDDVDVHLWEANDESWQTRSTTFPVQSGAESFIAGTASCRIAVEGVDELYQELQSHGVVHPNGQLRDQPWGTREFGVLDRDHNLITFFERQ
ncbi:MAG: VOC family protein [Caldilinea sp. CFX5]|nr:VOC family protein [Caldilinea sp. CFX5]